MILLVSSFLLRLCLNLNIKHFGRRNSSFFFAFRYVSRYVHEILPLLHEFRNKTSPIFFCLVIVNEHRQLDALKKKHRRPKYSLLWEYHNVFNCRSLHRFEMFQRASTVFANTIAVRHSANLIRTSSSPTKPPRTTEL